TNTSAVPSQPTRLKMRFTISAPPPFAVDRLRRQKQSKCDEAQVVDEVRRIDHALREVVEVADDRQIRRELVDGRPRKTADPFDDPEEEEYGEGDHAGHDLILREARDEQPDRDEAAAEQQQAEI